MNNSQTLSVSHHYTVSAERVYDAFLDPNLAGRFMFATPAGTMIKAELDPRVGGAFNFTDRREDGDVEHIGKYLELDRPTRIVFIFAVPKYSSDETVVTIEIIASEFGCDLTLSHAIEPEWADHLESMNKGWTMILNGLGETVGSD